MRWGVSSFSLAGVFTLLIFSFLLCLRSPHAAHASLASGELAALLEFKAACRSTVYGAKQFLPSWDASVSNLERNIKVNVHIYNLNI